SAWISPALQSTLTSRSACTAPNAFDTPCRDRRCRRGRYGRSAMTPCWRLGLRLIGEFRPRGRTLRGELAPCRPLWLCLIGRACRPVRRKGALSHAEPVLVAPALDVGMLGEDPGHHGLHLRRIPVRRLVRDDLDSRVQRRLLALLPAERQRVAWEAAEEGDIA